MPRARRPTKRIWAYLRGVFDQQNQFLNRELSWLDFDARVLALAERDDLPVLDRVRFLGIADRNLDEFFQVRIALLKNDLYIEDGERGNEWRDRFDQLAAVSSVAARLTHRMDRLYNEVLHPLLVDSSIVICGRDDLSNEDRRFLLHFFETRLFPVLTPLSVDPGHPFPHISDRSLNLAVVAKDPATGEERFARVKVPALLARLVPLPDRVRYVLLEDVISLNLDMLFPGMNIEGHWVFRIIRGVEGVASDDDDDTDDLLEAIEHELSRRRFTAAVRVQVQADMPADVVSVLIDELELTALDVSIHAAPLAISDLMQLCDLDRPDLKSETVASITPECLTTPTGPANFFDVISQADVFVHHPYESFTTTFEEFLHQAATDPKVLAIKQTLYRTAGDSGIVDSLIEAADAGKQVAVLVELKARFDERANIAQARALERAGVHVVYGIVGLKTHAKVCLVVRDEPDGIKRYCHIGTGNYNHRTARQYDDFGLFTSDAELTSDLTHLFNHLTGFSKEPVYKNIMVAPKSLRDQMIDLIANEQKAPEGMGRIVMKMNSLSDLPMINALYEASCAGVSIDLIVRGVCCLRPGVPGLSENIRVRSIVGRYLEHSRVVIFSNGNGEGNPLYLIGSADMMRRNLDRRVEVFAPIKDRKIQQRLDSIVHLLLMDERLAWQLDKSGSWTKFSDGDATDAQLAMHDLVRIVNG